MSFSWNMEKIRLNEQKFIESDFPAFAETQMLFTLMLLLWKEATDWSWYVSIKNHKSAPVDEIACVRQPVKLERRKYLWIYLVT